MGEEYSSLYAAEIYKKLGFYQTTSVKEDDGIQYIPMEYDVLQKAIPNWEEQ